MKNALPLGRYIIFFSVTLIGYWIATAALYSLMALYKPGNETILSKYEFLSGASYLFAAKQTLDYFYKNFWRMPESGEYWTLVIISSLATVAIQNIAWAVAGTSIGPQERVEISVLMFGAVALGYLDWPPFRYRNRRPE